MPKHTQSVMVKGDINTVFELVSHYFQSRGFSINNSIKPNSLDFERGSTWGYDGKSWVTKKCSLNIQLTETQKQIIIVCDYDISLWFWEGAHDINQINAEIEVLKSFMATSLQQPISTTQTSHADKDRICIKCKRKIPWDANLCPYCGHDYR